MNDIAEPPAILPPWAILPLDNPLPHAQRLARLLARLRQRYPEALVRFATAPARVAAFDRADPRLTLESISDALSHAARPCDTS